MDIQNILDHCSKLKICVVGDLIIDNYLSGTVDRISPEAPVPVVKKESYKTTLGGAGNVLMNLLNLGVDAELYCNYNRVPFWSEDLQKRIHTNQFPCSVKTRVMCGNHHLLRIDEEIPSDQMMWLQYRQFSWWEQLTNKSNQYDAFVMVDYGKGVLSTSTIGTLIDFANIAGKPIIVDAKKDFHRYATVDIMKCNDKELGDLNPHGELTRNRFKNLVVTNGERGISYYQEGFSSGVDGINVPLVDSCGCGDAVTSVLAMGYCMKELLTFHEALVLSNIAAAEVCKHVGVYAIKKEDIQHIILPVEYEEIDKSGDDDYPVIQ